MIEVAPIALVHLVMAAVTLCFGGGILLYERLAPGSRHFFLVTLAVAGWFATDAAGSIAAHPDIARLWWRQTVGFQALAAAAAFGLAVQLTGARRLTLARALWAVALAWFALSLFRPEVHDGVRLVMAGDYLARGAWVGLTLVLFVSGMVVATLIELALGYRAARTWSDRRRYLALLAAVGIAGVSLADYFFPAPLPGGLRLSSPAITLAVGIIGFAQVRYRTFAADGGFAAGDVLRAMGDGVLVCDEAGVIRVANDGALRLVGGGADGVVGRPVHEILRLDEPPGAPGREGAEALLRDRYRDEGGRLLTADGEAVPVSISAERLRGGGSPSGWVIVVRDVRDRVASARAIQASELRYRSLFWHHPGLAYEIAADGRIVQVNPAAEALLGARPGELVGRPFSAVVAPDSLERAVAVFQGVMQAEAQRYEVDVLGLKGRRRTIQGVSIPIMVDGRVTGAFGVALDITEETQTRRDLEVQRKYFAELFEASPEAIAIIGRDGVVRGVNGEFTRLFGYGAGEVQGRPLDDLIVPAGEEASAAELLRLAVDGRVEMVDLVRRRKDGTPVEVSLLARRIHVPGGDGPVYAIYRDEGERKRTERKLREREEELRHAQKLEVVGKLAGGIAHDFNNLLTVINGHARFVLDDLAPGADIRDDLEEIERAGKRAAALTQQLLAFSRRQVLLPQDLDLNLVVRDMERLLQRLIGSHIRLEVELAEDLPPVMADRGQVEQVAMNLIVNARDAMPEGGVLTIRTEAAELAADDDRLERWGGGADPGAYVVLVIEDTGAGMPTEVLSSIFDPFFTTKARGKGTGLGLPTAFGIAKQSGGHIDVESEEGRGSRFSVYLPVSPELEDGSAAPAPVPAAAAPRAGPGATVLVAEDEPSVRRLATRVLESRGYQVLAASNGAEALALARSHPHPIDLVLTDVVMPEMGGHELAREIEVARPGTPVLLMSGYDDEMVTGRVDPDYFLPKPFAPATLVERVGAVLALR